MQCNNYVTHSKIVLTCNLLLHTNITENISKQSYDYTNWHLLCQPVTTSVSLYADVVVVVWTHNDVLLLIESYRSHEKDFKNPMLRRNEVWKVIAQEMNYIKHDDCFGWVICQKKWSNLEIRYKQKKDKKGKTGRGSENWVYFELLDEILGSRASVKSVSASCKPVMFTSSSCTVSSATSVVKPECSVSSVGSISSCVTPSSVEPPPTTSSSLINPPSDSSDTEQCDGDAAKSLSAAGVKRKQVGSRGQNFGCKKWGEKLTSDMNKWHDKMDDRMTRFENIERDRVGVLTEMKDIMKEWVDCMKQRNEC